MNLNQEVTRRIRGLIVFTAVIIVCLWKNDMVLGWLSRCLGIVLPFLLGGAIAFIMNVPMSFVERKLYKYLKIKEKYVKALARPVALISTLIFIVSILLLVIFVVVPQLTITLGNLGSSIQVFIPEVANWAGDVFANNPEIETWIMSLEYDWAAIAQYGINFLQLGAGSVVDTTVSVAMGLFSAVTTFFIAFIFAIYLVLQKELLGVQLRKVFLAFMRKGRAEALFEVGQLTYKTFSSFLTGQCVEAIILGSIIMVALLIFQIPFALLIGILVAFTALIPIFGAFAGCGIGAFLIFIEDPTKALIFIILFIVIQQLEGNLIYPHVVGNSVGLPAIWVLVAVSVGGSLMGIVGMLIFIPITSVLYALFREVVYIKLKQNKVNIMEIVKVDPMKRVRGEENIEETIE